jgi:hypothetical protein
VAGAGAIKTRTATALIPAWTAVTADGDGFCKPVDLSDPDVPPAILGVCAAGGGSGSVVEFQSLGDVDGPAWTWAASDVLYLSASGSLTNVTPTSGWLVRVGVATSTTHVVIDRLSPVWLAPASTTPLPALDAAALIEMLLNALPTTEPTSSGVWWLNNGRPEKTP